MSNDDDTTQPEPTTDGFAALAKIDGEGEDEGYTVLLGFIQSTGEPVIYITPPDGTDVKAIGIGGWDTLRQLSNGIVALAQYAGHPDNPPDPAEVN